jgi:hypothetical protein
VAENSQAQSPAEKDGIGSGGEVNHALGDGLVESLASIALAQRDLTRGEQRLARKIHQGWRAWRNPLNGRRIR